MKTLYIHTLNDVMHVFPAPHYDWTLGSEVVSVWTADKKRVLCFPWTAIEYTETQSQ